MGDEGIPEARRPVSLLLDKNKRKQLRKCPPHGDQMVIVETVPHANLYIPNMLTGFAKDRRCDQQPPDIVTEAQENFHPSIYEAIV